MADLIYTEGVFHSVVIDGGGDNTIITEDAAAIVIETAGPGEQSVIITGGDTVSEIVTDRVVQSVVESITAGPQGAPGSMSNTVSRVAAVDLGGHRVIALNDEGQCVYGDHMSKFDRILGISKGAAESGKVVVVAAFGEIEESSWNLDPSKGLFLGTEGLIVQSAPESGTIVPLGFVVTPTRIFISIGSRIERE